MTDLRTAAQQALKILELEGWGYPSPKTAEAITALKAALVEDAMQKFTDVNQELEAALAEPVEPVAWMFVDDTGMKFVSVDQPHKHCQPLYTAPPQRTAETVQGPVAYLWVDPETQDYVVDRCDHPLSELIPVYTAPPQRTADQMPDSKHATIAEWWAEKQRKPPATIDEIFDRMNKAPKGVFYGHDPMTIWMEAWRAAEQHGIKDD